MLARDILLPILALGIIALTAACSEDVSSVSFAEAQFGSTTTFMGMPTEGSVNETTAAEWLFDQMQGLSPTNRSFGAVLDLQQEAEVSVEYWRTSSEGREEFHVTMETDDGTLRWVIIDYIVFDGECCVRLPGQVTEMAWTYNNGRARRWLRDNDFLDVCDRLRDLGREYDRDDAADEAVADVLELTGEDCRWALEGGSLD